MTSDSSGVSARSCGSASSDFFSSLSAWPPFSFSSARRSFFFLASSSSNSRDMRETSTSFFIRLRQCSSASARVAGHGASLRLTRYDSSTEKSHSAFRSRFVAKSIRSRRRST